MLLRGFEAVSLGVSQRFGVHKKRRPSSSMTLAIWPLAPGAKKFAQRTSFLKLAMS